MPRADPTRRPAAARDPVLGALPLDPHREGRRAVKVADLAKWAKKHPDPNDTEKNPADSNAYGLAPLADGSVLVTDAAANSLLQVKRTGKIKTVARLPLQPISTAHVPPSDGRSPDDSR